MSESISYEIAAYTNWTFTDHGRLQIGSSGTAQFESRLKFTPQKQMRSVKVHVELDTLAAIESSMQNADLYAAVVTSSTVQEPTPQKIWHWKSGTKVQQGAAAWGEVTLTGDFHAGTTYYLWLWGILAPGGVPAGAYNANKNNNAWTTLTGELAGLAHIDNGSGFQNYEIYIDNGTEFVRYIPYIDTGSAWEELE